MKGAPQATTPGENASLQVRRKSVRRRNWSKLPTTASPSTPFFSFFPFFSSLFFFFFAFLAFENGEILPGKSDVEVLRRRGEEQKPRVREEEDGT